MKRHHTNPALMAYLKTLPTGRPDPDIIYVTNETATCNGGTVGHPRVYLTINSKTGFVVCPYCGCIYVYDQDHLGSQKLSHQ